MSRWTRWAPFCSATRHVSRSCAFACRSLKELGFNGTFNAFRILAQDAKGFNEYLSKAANELKDHPDVNLLLAPGSEARIGEGLDYVGALREVVAAQMCGRWRNGIPYGSSPDAQLPSKPISETNFDYDRASRCPAGSHMRRVNPRSGTIVQRIANHTRRMIRRGMPYGPDYDADHPDNQERGLLGNFIGASLGAQFEAIMCDWLNLGLQDPRHHRIKRSIDRREYAGDELVRSVAQERRQYPSSRIPALRDHPRRGLHFPAKPAGDQVLVEANRLSGRVRSESGNTARLIPECRSAPPTPPRSAPAWETDRTR